MMAALRSATKLWVYCSLYQGALTKDAVPHKETVNVGPPPGKSRVVEEDKKVKK